MNRKEQQRERQILHTMGTCEHFTGIQNDICKAGVNIRELVGGPDFGWGARLPCMLSDADRCEVQCGKRSLPTRTEAEAQEVKDDAQMEVFLKAARAAHQHAKDAGLGIGNGGRGEMPCPTGCGGTLRYSVAGINGHMHAACSRDACLSWME